MDNNKYFILSGFISLSLFLTFLFLFAFMLFVESKEKVYALEKKNYIAVSLVVESHQQKQKKKKTVTPQRSSKSQQTAKEIDVNDLFSDIWTPKPKVIKQKKVNSKRLDDIAKKVKTLKKEKHLQFSKKVQSIQNSDLQEQQSTSAANEVNEYLAKIQAIVCEHFHVPPNTQGESVKAVIELDPLGKVKDFRILRYSQSEALNNEVDKIKERLKNVIFPKNPQNTTSRTVVVLISKE
jgi:protein TonB